MGKLIGLLVLGGVVAWLFGTELFPGNSKLYDAIADGDTAQVRQLLASGADPNSQAAGLTGQRSTVRRYSYPPLVYALRRNKAEIALALVGAGADCERQRWRRRDRALARETPAHDQRGGGAQCEGGRVSGAGPTAVRCAGRPVACRLAGVYGLGIVLTWSPGRLGGALDPQSDSQRRSPSVAMA